MAIVRPFRAVRPAKEYAAKVACLPYDVMNREEAENMASGNPYSYLHICRSEIDMPEVKNPYIREVYEKAKSNINDFLKEGVFIRDEKPLLYIYRQIMDGRVQTGVVGCVSVDEYGNNTIKKHELTRFDKEIDRINHFDICNANTEPVFMVYRDDLRIRIIIEGWTACHDCEYQFKTIDGTSHIFWKITDDDVIKNLTELFGEIPSLYIADGHHRSASAYKVGLKRREENKNYSGDEEFNFFMSVLFPDRDLKIYDYNRVVAGLNGLTEEEFIDKVAEAGFIVEEKGKEPFKPSKKHTIGMFLAGKWYQLTVKPEIIPDDIIGSMDVSILQESLLAPILGILEPREDKRIDFIGGIRGLEELERRCRNDMTLAFAVYPVSMNELMSISDDGEIMPPKSTWFEPKLESGLFIHEF